MKILLLRSVALLMPLVFLALASIGQAVTDPSNSPGYDAAKNQAVGGASTSRLRGAVSQQRRVSANAAPVGGNAAPALSSSTGCFIPVDASYTAVPRNDDGSYGPITLPFAFNLYGSSYTKVWINTNGNLTFTGAYSDYSATGFPFGVPMVAPFWGDVDTNNPVGGQIYFKLSATNLIVTWNNVGYYYLRTDKTNTFQAIIGSSDDALLGPGQNVSLRYGDMQWTTGDASGGISGFGGTPATVGVNNGNSLNYVQVGRFSLNNSDYDGPGGANDGVNYLDGQCFGLDLNKAGNIPPSANNLPLNKTVNVACGQTVTINPQFLAPEVNQAVVVGVNTGGLCNTTVTTSNGTTANTSITITGSSCNVGTHPIILTATDNGSPVGVTTVTLNVVVASCCDLQLAAVPTRVACPGGTDGALDLTVSNGTAPLAYRWSNGSTAEDLTGVPAGPYTVTVTDANGCSATGTYTIGQLDAVGPTALTRAFLLPLGPTGTAKLTAANVDNGSFDNCGVASMTVSPSSFNCANVGVNTVTLTVTDVSGNASSAPATVTVIDAQKPTITAPAAVAVSTDAGQCSATGVALGSATAGDNCTGAVVSNDAPAVFPKGSTTVTWTATDAAGNTATATQTVTANDTERPALSIPAAIVRSAPASQCGAVVTFSPTATDNCAGATVVASPASGSTFAVGTTTVSVTATDASGNVSTGSFPVTVNDVTAPAVATRNVTVALVNGTSTVTADQVNDGSADACGIASFSLSRTAFSCANIGANPVTLTVTDMHGNVASAAAVVTVTGSVPVPTITVTPSGSVYTGGVPTTLYLGYGSQSATLVAAGGMGYAWSPAQGLSNATSANPVFTATTAGTYIYTVTATSASGCSASQRVTLKVVDAGGGKNHDKVIVCHNGHEISISPNAVDTHLTGHPGDQLGACGPAARASTSPSAAGGIPNELLVYPNPTAGQATVSFRPSLDGKAEVVVYNEFGQRVATLYDGTVTSGQLYAFTFDSRNLAVGLYECRMVLNGKIEVLRLVIAR